MGLFSSKKYEFDQIVTRTGDDGKSSNWNGDRFSKSDDLFEVLGNIDELTCWMAKVRHTGETNISHVEHIQHALYRGMSMVATDPWMVNGEPTNGLYSKLDLIKGRDIDDLELLLKSLLDSGIKIDNKFVLPGKTPKSADIDIARTVCRRAERSIVKLISKDNSKRFDLIPVSKYLNRLSDVLFTYARYVEQRG